MPKYWGPRFPRIDGVDYDEMSVEIDWPQHLHLDLMQRLLRLLLASTALN